MISAGRPRTAIEELAFRPIVGWPTGVYSTLSPFKTNLMVVSELPKDRSTLLLRLLGAGRVLIDAIAELGTLPRGALERSLAGPALLQLTIDVPALGRSGTREEEELMQTAARILFDEWEQKQRASQGALLLVDAYELRFGPMPADLRAVIESTRDDVKLREWHRLAVVGSADEVASAIRQTAST